MLLPCLIPASLEAPTFASFFLLFGFIDFFFSSFFLFLSLLPFSFQFSIIPILVISYCCKLDHLRVVNEVVCGERYVLWINNYERKKEEAVWAEEDSEL